MSSRATSTTRTTWISTRWSAACCRRFLSKSFRRRSDVTRSPRGSLTRSRRRPASPSTSASRCCSGARPPDRALPPTHEARAKRRPRTPLTSASDGVGAARPPRPATAVARPGGGELGAPGGARLSKEQQCSGPLRVWPAAPFRLYEGGRVVNGVGGVGSGAADGVLMSLSPRRVAGTWLNRSGSSGGHFQSEPSGG
jgi:hypothetical protein